MNDFSPKLALFMYYIIIICFLGGGDEGILISPEDCMIVVGFVTPVTFPGLLAFFFHLLSLENGLNRAELQLLQYMIEAQVLLSH